MASDGLNKQTKEVIALIEKWQKTNTKLTSDYSKGIKSLKQAKDDYEDRKKKLYVRFWWVALIFAIGLVLWITLIIFDKTSTCRMEFGVGDYKLTVLSSRPCEQ